MDPPKARLLLLVAYDRAIPYRHIFSSSAQRYYPPSVIRRKQKALSSVSGLLAAALRLLISYLQTIPCSFANLASREFKN